MVALDDEYIVVRPLDIPPVANPVELACPVRHDHETVIGVDVPYCAEDGEHESDGVSGGTTFGFGIGLVGGNVYGGIVGFCLGICWDGYCGCGAEAPPPPPGCEPPVGLEPPVGVQPYS